jgi:hypothetical protein
MASEIVNRAMPADGFALTNHLMAKALHLADNGYDKLIELAVDDA